MPCLNLIRLSEMQHQAEKPEGKPGQYRVGGSRKARHLPEMDDRPRQDPGYRNY